VDIKTCLLQRLGRAHHVPCPPAVTTDQQLSLHILNPYFKGVESYFAKYCNIKDSAVSGFLLLAECNNRKTTPK
jgi:hypothetical protein